MKSGHGGPRAGSGRKRVLSRLQCLDVGETYDRLWQEAKLIEAHAKHLSNKKRAAEEADIEAAVAANLNPPKHLSRHPPALKQRRHIRGKELDKIGRRLSLQLKRPKGRREDVIAVTIDWCKKKYGIDITPRRVAACRTEHRRLLRDRT